MRFCTPLFSAPPPPSGVLWAMFCGAFDDVSHDGPEQKHRKQRCISIDPILVSAAEIQTIAVDGRTLFREVLRNSLGAYHPKNSQPQKNRCFFFFSKLQCKLQVCCRNRSKIARTNRRKINAIIGSRNQNLSVCAFSRSRRLFRDAKAGVV